MFNRYLLIATGILLFGCVLFYNLWDKTKIELNQVKAEKITLEQEIKRRDENERNLSKKLTELARLYDTNADWATASVPSDIVKWMHKSCKACQ